jgi:hypothetical protein
MADANQAATAPFSSHFYISQCRYLSTEKLENQDLLSK